MFLSPATTPKLSVAHVDYELGRLLSREGDDVGAKAQFDLVLSGKGAEINSSGKKGKYSMEVCGAVHTLIVLIYLYISFPASIAHADTCSY